MFELELSKEIDDDLQTSPMGRIRLVISPWATIGTEGSQQVCLLAVWIGHFLSTDPSSR